jgi:hypothetical protein
VATGIALLGVGTWSAARAGRADSSPDLPGSPGGSDAILNDALLVAAGALMAALLIYLAPILSRQGRRARHAADDDEPRPALWLRLLAGAAVILTIAAALLLLARNRQESTEPLPVAPPTTEQSRPQPSDGAGARGWSALGLFGAGAIAVVVAVVWWQRRGHGRGNDSFADDIVTPVPAGPLDLGSLAPVDAIRAAYAAARRSLASIGVAARAPETPYEYLDRVRADAPAFARPIATLTRLFELARFSHHPVTAEMKADAIAAHDTVTREVARTLDAMVIS